MIITVTTIKAPIIITVMINCYFDWWGLHLAFQTIIQMYCTPFSLKMLKCHIYDFLLATLGSHFHTEKVFAYQAVSLSFLLMPPCFGTPGPNTAESW